MVRRRPLLNMQGERTQRLVRLAAELPPTISQLERRTAFTQDFSLTNEYGDSMRWKFSYQLPRIWSRFEGTKKPTPGPNRHLLKQRFFVPCTSNPRHTCVCTRDCVGARLTRLHCRSGACTSSSPHHTPSIWYEIEGLPSSSERPPNTGPLSSLSLSLPSTSACRIDRDPSAASVEHKTRTSSMMTSSRKRGMNALEKGSCGQAAKT